MKIYKILFLLISLILLNINSVNAQNYFFDTTSVGKYDMGKSWTFDEFPKQYLKERYGFNATDEWIEKVKLSAIKFSSWCSSSFVSENGLIMTNHHCIDFITDRINKEGENIDKNGFYANTLQDERKVQGLFVDNLVLMNDISEEVFSKLNNNKDKSKADILIEIKKEYDESTGLNCVIVPFYNGSKYSVYGYKRYNDIRAVYFNESAVGLYGGDPDNFTYPRYNADFAFLRAYDENGQPAKIENYFKWSTIGPKPDELLFVVGNPGKTQRLKTVEQLKYMGQVDSRNSAYIFEQLMKMYYDMIEMYPEHAEELIAEMGAISNTAKVTIGEYKAVINPYLIKRKQMFEDELKNIVFNDVKLKEKYSHIWNGIKDLQDELSSFGNIKAGYTVSYRGLSVNLFNTAVKLYTLAENLKSKNYNSLTDSLKKYIDEKIEDAFNNSKNRFGKEKPKHNYDETAELKKLAILLNLIELNLGSNNQYVKLLLDNKSGEEAAKNLLKISILSDKAKVKKLFYEGLNSVYNSKDPVINFVFNTRKKLEEYQNRSEEISSAQAELENRLGEVIYSVYGSKVPPDATFTLRISDGIVKGYEYNGTIAPPITTFYGMYDRYYSFNKKYPWDLPQRWAKPGKDLDLSTPYNFALTSDITGGSSGSPIINTNGEVVGIAFDGNIESLAGDFLFDEQINRCIGVTSQGILEILGDIADADRIKQELIKGKIE
ncbi:MAG TPA: S46 family peptidase [Melioribacteraceae bacterium]|nr:S46 family peptidase [Melioribacteraceae bacterium]